ncbi:MAG TPA: ABC transporter permease [Myxococcales bacterium]|nr:ABC transporter permease [Myxococcales bacterium]
MGDLLQDLRIGLRSLSRTRGFTAAAIISLALGIGANSTIFSVVDAVLLRPLPYPAPAELFSLRANQSPPDLRDLREQSKTLQAVAGYAGHPFDLVSGDEPEQLMGTLVAGPLFEALQVQPVAGRVLTQDDDRPSAAPVVVISEALRQRILTGREAIGASLLLSGKSYTVVGVMPKSFRLPEGDSQLWAPLSTGYPEAVEARGAHFLTAVARVAKGAPAQLELDAVAQRLASLNPVDDRDLRFALMPLQERVTRNVRSSLLFLLCAVGLVLLVACANFASLLLARGAARRHELAVRAALGASRFRIVRQLLTESAILALAGGVAAALLAAWGLPALLSLDAAMLPQIASASVDWRVLAATAALAIGAGLFVGLLPALQISRLDVASALKDASPQASGRARMRSALVVAEVALAVVLLAGAGLVLRTLWNLRQTPLGFQPARVLTLRVDLPGARYTQVAQQTEFFDRLLAGVATQPGVQAAGIVSELPLGGNHLTHNALIKGAPPVLEGAEPEVGAHVVSGGYFPALQIPLLEGRLFDARDRADTAQVVIVNAAFARKFFSGRSAIGSRLRFSREEHPRWMTIAGVVGDVREALQDEQEPTAYVPYAQNGSPWHRWESLVVRAAPGAEAMLSRELKQQVWAADPQLPITLARPMEEVLSRSLAQRRLELMLLSLFAGLALLLGAVGIHGLVSYTVSRRTHEFGVRLVLGATRGRVLRMVLGQGLRLALLGLAIGTLVAVALGRLLSSLLFGVAPADPLTYAAIALVIGGTALAACWVPAARAGHIEPMAALRQQ